jgi:hypothetical protein
VIVSYASPEGRRVVLADANPAIIALRTSSLLSLEEAVNAAAAARGYAGGPGARPDAARPDTARSDTARSDTGAAAEAGPQEPSGAEPPPNLGPPPERLDWRKPR